MAMFDNSYFDPATYQGGMAGNSWLEEALRSGLLGRAMQQQQQQDQPTSTGNYGGIQYPIYGQAPPQADTTELMAQAKQQAQQQQAPQPQKPPAPGPFDYAEPGTLAHTIGGLFGAPVMHGKPTDDIREFEYAKRGGFTGTFTDWMLKKKGLSGQYGLHPIYGVDDKGDPVIIQINNEGKAVKTPLPEGTKISNKPIMVDAGTHNVLLDPQTRQVVATIPKEVFKAAEQKAAGTKQGEADALLASMSSKMPGLEKVVTRLDDLSNKATYTKVGQALDEARRQANLNPREGAVAKAEYDATVSNQILPLLRDTFGAQFTEKEGARLQATLGAPDLSPQEKQAVLRAFIAQKRRDVEALTVRTGGGIKKLPGGWSVEETK